MLVVSQPAACVLAVAAGIPRGIALFSLMDGGELPSVRPPAGMLVALALATAAPALFAVIVAIPALLAPRLYHHCSRTDESGK